MWPPCDVIRPHNARCLDDACLWELKPRVRQTMESFSLLSISGLRLSPSALSTFPDIMSSRATSLPGISKTAPPTEAASPAQARPLRCLSSTLLPGVHSAPLSPDCILGDPQNGAQLRQKHTIYRPWFSPYSYFVCADRESCLGAPSSPEGQRDEGGGDSCLPEDEADSVCASSSSSPENTCPRQATQKPGRGPDATDYITSQDILTASTWQPAQQNGYKCAACCRLYPTLRSLKGHIKGGVREGFSCRAYYRRLKALWGKEQSVWPGDRLSTGSCQAFK
ncbi:spermatogenesis-associated protein 46 [Hipposideros larvatus]